MPDLKSELSKVINSWEPDTSAPEAALSNNIPKPYFTTTNNVCRATFEHIRDNPGKTRKEICKSLLAKGYKENSTTTLIGQMIKQQQVRETQGLLYTVIDAYRPLKGSKAWAKLQDTAQRKKVTIVNTRTGEVFNPRVERAPVPAPVEKEWTVKSVIDNMNVYQAMAVYNELRKIFEE